MSLVAHPERNVFITGKTESPYIDVARVLSVRLGRRICDIQAEGRKRKLLALSAMFTGPRDDSVLYADVLRECSMRRNQIACLDTSSLGAIEGYQSYLNRYFVVALIDSPGAEHAEAADARAGPAPESLDSDLQLNWEGFQARQLARIIAHCLYG